MAVTIKDIAKAAGVSPATVSRTINDHYSISEKTKQKVRQVMDELGYTAEHSKEEVKRIGVVFPISTYDAYENPFYLDTLRGIGIICNRRQYTVHMITGANEKEIRKSIMNSDADGYIFLYSDIGDKLIDYMYEQNIKFVLIGKATTHVNETLCIDTDNIQAAFDATNYLIMLGHKKIGYIGTPEKKVFSGDRKAGYIKALMESDIDINERYILSLTSSTDFDSRPVKKLLMSDNHPTAFLICDDIYALILENLISECGLKVPDDISLIGFNNSIFSRLLHPKLTSIDVNARQLGIEAAAQLIKHIENPQLYATKIIVPYFIIKRDSCKDLNHNP